MDDCSLRSGVRNLCLGDQVAVLIYLSRQPHTQIYTHAFVLYTHTILFNKLYIYTHPIKNKK